MAVLEVSCPGCHATLKAPETLAGKKARCKKCGVAIRIPGTAPTGDTGGDGQFLSTIDLPSPAAPPAVSAGNPFDFSAPAVDAPPAAKKSAAVPKPAPKAAPAPPPVSTSKSTPKAPVLKPAAAKPAVPAAPQVKDDIPTAAPVDDEAPPSADPLSFDDLPTPVAKTPAASADPFAFGTGPEVPAAPAADKPLDTSAPAAAAPRTRKRRSDDLTKLGKLSPHRPRVTKKGGLGKLILVVGVFGLIVGGVVGAVLLYLNQKKDGEQAKVEKKDDKKEDRQAEAPPTTDQSPKKGEPKDAVNAAAKDTAKNPAARPASRSRAAAAAAGPPALPASVRAIQFLPEAAKREMLLERTTKLDINAALGPKTDSAFAKARRVFPPLKRDIDPAVLWQTEVGFQGRGEKLLLGIYSPLGGKQVNKVEVDGDGLPDPVCDLSVSADLFIHAHTADGKVTVWNTREGKKVVDGFAPYADKPALKDTKIAAVYLTEPPNRFVTVSSAGAVHVFEVATKAPVGDFTPAKPPSSPLAAGKSVAPGPGRGSVVMVAGGQLYRVTVRDTVAGEAVGDLGGDVGRSLGLAASGDGKLLYVFETGGDKKEKAVMSVRPDDKHQLYRWPEEAGDPVTVGWCGDHLAAVGTTRGAAVWFVAEGDGFRPLALIRTPGDKGLHVSSDDHWSLLPDPADPKKCVLVAFASPQQAFESVLDTNTKKQPPTVRLDDKGLSK
ncbi:MAG: putative Fe-S oxidoreductase [Gemmataceae bacterium]|nr:putative Fe-S oxidoreductase [Gemmataceae bacterium]